MSIQYELYKKYYPIKSNKEKDWFLFINRGYLSNVLCYPEYEQIVLGPNSKVLVEDVNRIFPDISRRLPTLWTRSCFISTVGSVSLETVKSYIESQKGK